MPTSQTQQPQSESLDPSFLSRILRIVEDQNLIAGEFPTNEKVVEFRHPRDLEQEFDLQISKKPTTFEALEKICIKAAKYSVKTCTPKFYNQLYHGVDEFGLAGSWLSDALNTNNYTFEVAPVFILAERAILEYIRRKFGWTQGDGIFCPGGSISNMYGIILARHKAFPEIKTKGLLHGGKPLVIFTSDESHYSISKGANWLGIGTENVIKIKTDDSGKMIPDLLEQAIEQARAEGKVPFFVNATAGSTVMGAFDDLNAISQICKRQGLWMHVDACWGGAVVLSSVHKRLIDGCQFADSIAWNPHKMIGAPLQCSAFIVRHAGLLHQANSASATYLFQQDKFYDVKYDTGDKSVQCGRKVDGFKLWLMMKARGETYFEGLVDNAFAQAKYFMNLVEKTPGFRPAFEFGFSCTNVCFEYIPERLRGCVETPEWKEELAQIPPKLKEALIKKGSMMIGYQPLKHKNKDNFFRMVVHCVPPPTQEDMDFAIKELDLCGKFL